MITDEHNEPLEGQVREILEGAGWADSTQPDEGRIEVIAYRACLEAARMTAAGPACCSAPSHAPPVSLPGRSSGESLDRCVCGASTLCAALGGDDRLDHDSSAGSVRT